MQRLWHHSMKDCYHQYAPGNALVVLGTMRWARCPMLLLLPLPRPIHVTLCEILSL